MVIIIPTEQIPFMNKPVTLIGTNRAKLVGIYQAKAKKAAKAEKAVEAPAVEDTKEEKE